MVHKRLTSSEQNIKDKLESESRKIIERIERKLLNVGSSHFMPLKWALQVLYEARDADLVEEKMFNALISEINHIHAQCDRLVSFKHESFSWGLTIGAMCAVYLYFTTGTVSFDHVIYIYKHLLILKNGTFQVRQLWNYLEDTQNYMFLSIAISVNFLIFVSFLIIMRHAEQIVHPYNPDHDVFELNRILNDKLEVASFVLNIKNDLRKEIKNKNLFS